MGALENLLGGIYAYGMKKKIYNSCCSFNGYSFDMLYKPFFFTSSAGSEKPST